VEDRPQTTTQEQQVNPKNTPFSFTDRGLLIGPEGDSSAEKGKKVRVQEQQATGSPPYQDSPTQEKGKIQGKGKGSTRNTKHQAGDVS